MQNLGDNERFDLEEMIDKAGLVGVLDAIMTICHEKEDHVRSNWQDENLAKHWASQARRIATMSAKITDV